MLLFLGGYSVNGGSGENTYGRKSMGQELRVNNVTSPEFTSVQHGSRALAIKDMRKSQGKAGQTGCQTHTPCRDLGLLFSWSLVANTLSTCELVGLLRVENDLQVMLFCIPFPVNCFVRVNSYEKGFNTF